MCFSLISCTARLMAVLDGLRQSQIIVAERRLVFSSLKSCPRPLKQKPIFILRSPKMLRKLASCTTKSSARFHAKIFCHDIRNCLRITSCKTFWITFGIHAGIHLGHCGILASQYLCNVPCRAFLVSDLIFIFLPSCVDPYTFLQYSNQ